MYPTRLCIWSLVIWSSLGVRGCKFKLSDVVWLFSTVFWSPQNIEEFFRWKQPGFFEFSLPTMTAWIKWPAPVRRFKHNAPWLFVVRFTDMVEIQWTLSIRGWNLFPFQWWFHYCSTYTLRIFLALFSPTNINMARSLTAWCVTSTTCEFRR